MKDQEYYVDRFSADIDRILEQHGRADEEAPPREYAEMLALAETLAALDFSKGNPLQPHLRQRVLTRLEAQHSAAQRPFPRWRRLLLPRPRRTLAAVVALVALVALVGWTPAGRAVAQAVEQFVKEMRWPHTTVQQFPPAQRPTATVDADERFDEELAAGRAWEFRFEGRGFAGCCSDAVRNEVVSLERAVDEAGFDVYVPTFLPDGYVLSEVRLLDVKPYLVFMIYEGADGRLGLGQSLVGITSEEHPNANTAIVESRAIGVVTDGTVEEMMVGTTPAALIDGESLVWEENSVSYRLIGPGLDAYTLIQIAESLAPAQ